MLKKILVGVILLYVLVVVGFESMLGYTQPENQGTLVITTYDNGEANERVVTRIHVDDELYVAVNHWPRLWYWRLLDEPVKQSSGLCKADRSARMSHIHQAAIFCQTCDNQPAI